MKSRQPQNRPDPIPDPDHALAAEAVYRLQGYYLPWIEEALEAFDTETLWKRPNDAGNSVGNLLLHLNGNVRQWIQHGFRGDEDNRDRNAEFAASEGATPAELFAALKETVDEACEILLQQHDLARLLEPRTIQGLDTTGFSAIVHVVEHFSCHTGQIVWISKALSGKDLRFYDL